MSRIESAWYALACLILPGISCYAYLNWPQEAERLLTRRSGGAAESARDWTAVTPAKTYYMTTIVPAGDYKMPGED